MSLVISTAWNAFRCTDAERMIFELKDLGFNEVELSFNLTSEMVDTVDSLVRRGEIKVSSVHNFCPIPEGLKREEALPDFFSMSSGSEDERGRSVEFAKRSIDTASRLNAAAVVLHCGRVGMEDIFKDLAGLYEREGPSGRNFLELRSRMVSMRRAAAPGYLDNSLRSLDELNAYAGSRGIFLGVETRYYYHEIPSLEEVGVILDRFRGGRIRYWHDTGHAQVSENLGLARQEEYLSRYKEHLLGLHLHDVRGTSDHKPPSTGELDFARLKPFITPETIKVMEVHNPAPPEDLIRGREFLETVFNEKP